jgi:hypothetical protein
MDNISGSAESWLEDKIVSVSSEKPLQTEREPLNLEESLARLSVLQEHLKNKYAKHNTKELYDAIILLTMASRILKN